MKLLFNPVLQRKEVHWYLKLKLHDTKPFTCALGIPIATELFQKWHCHGNTRTDKKPSWRTVQNPILSTSKAAQHEKAQNNSILNFLQKFMLFLCLQAWKFVSYLQDCILPLPTVFSSSSRHKCYFTGNALISNNVILNLANKQIPQRELFRQFFLLWYN